MKTFLKIVLAVLIALLVLYVYRFPVLATLGNLVGPPGLTDAKEEPGAIWFDDYYTVFNIDERTWAIGETRYWQKNFNYLIVGENRAILYDAGPGVRDIRPVVKSLTDLPVTFVPSHFHYDHVGNGITFDNIAIIDLPYFRNRAPNDLLSVEFEEHLGRTERFEAPTFKVTDWWKHATEVDLGGRILRVLYTPGHTTDGISLIDEEAQLAFTGDFFTPGALAEFTPNGGMGDYLFGIEGVLEYASEETRFFGAHRNLMKDEADHIGIPHTTLKDVRDTREALVDIRDGKKGGSGWIVVIYTINDLMQLWTDPVMTYEWEVHHHP